MTKVFSKKLPKLDIEILFSTLEYGQQSKVKDWLQIIYHAWFIYLKVLK